MVWLSNEKGMTKMKKRNLFVLAAVSAMILPACAAMADVVAIGDSSNEVEEAATDIEVSEEEAEAPAASDQVNADVIWGEWYGAGYIGEYDYSLHGDAYIFPDGTLSDGTNLLPYEKTDDTHFTVSGMDGLTITGEYGQLTQEEIEEYDVGDYSMFYHEVGSPRIILTVSLPDPNNPLATYEVSTSSIFLKQTGQSEFIKLILDGRTWKIGDNTLKIADGTLDLNNGSNSGTISCGTDGDATRVMFTWDGSSSISYLVTQVTDSSITLSNKDNEADIITLELSGDAETVQEAVTE